MSHSRYAIVPYAVSMAVALMLSSPTLRADETAEKPVPTKHQLMKECMAKEKASDGGMPKEDMKNDCKQVTKTESENAKVEQETTQQDAAKETTTAPAPSPPRP